MLTEAGAIKVRGFTRRPQGERWNQEELEMVKGAPWEPIPGRAEIEVKAEFSMKEDDVAIQD